MYLSRWPNIFIVFTLGLTIRTPNSQCPKLDNYLVALNSNIVAYNPHDHQPEKTAREESR